MKIMASIARHLRHAKTPYTGIDTGGWPHASGAATLLDVVGGERIKAASAWLCAVMGVTFGVACGNNPYPEADAENQAMVAKKEPQGVA